MAHPSHQDEYLDGYMSIELEAFDYFARIADEEYYIELQDAMEARGGPLPFDDCLALASEVAF
jgi:hypothetical protein